MEAIRSSERSVATQQTTRRHIIEDDTLHNHRCGNLKSYIMYTIYRVPQKSVNLNHSLVWTGMVRFKPGSQFVERYHSVVSCALNMEDLILNSFRVFSEQ
jgi:hypothetical protein